jgi:soluble P-type ATPase
MIKIDIPGETKIEAEHLVLDFNGTLAIDGRLIEGIENLLELLSHKLMIHILTADTFGTSKSELEPINCKHVILNPYQQDELKEQYVIDLGKENVIAIGNGRNDRLMIKQAALGIAVIQKEGIFGELICVSDIVTLSITEALDLLLNPLRIIATLRN